MGFFGQFNAWLTALLSKYIATNTVVIAQALEPAIVTLGTIYVMIWGYLQLTGQVQEPFLTGVKRIAVLGVIFGLAIHLWLYQTLIVDTFFNAPAELAGAVVGAYDPVTIVDQIMNTGADAGGLLLAKAGVFHGNFSFYIAGIAVYLIISIIAVYTMFLLALSRIALSILLALGPLFVVLLLFDSTKRFFEAWLAQLSNYAFITILTVLVAALMLTVVSSAAQAATSAGGGIQIAEAVRVCLAAGLTVLIMRQVMPMAAGLASGLALSTFGVVSAVVAWGLGRSFRSTGQYGRGLLDRETSRWDPLSRKAGYYTRAGLAAGWRKLKGPNAVRAS
ncbi:MAG TPA: type IV secretion system protein [Steroidobacteraceae bacterium]|nr:type IV secretion system protein [Steroidobacteraceae bacterium]